MRVYACVCCVCVVYVCMCARMCVCFVMYDVSNLV